MLRDVSSIARVLTTSPAARVKLSDSDVQVVGECLQKYADHKPEKHEAEQDVEDIRAAQLWRIHTRIERDCPELARIWRRVDDIELNLLFVVCPELAEKLLAPPLSHKELVRAFLDTGGSVYDLAPEWETWAREQGIAGSSGPVAESKAEKEARELAVRAFPDHDSRLKWVIPCLRVDKEVGIRRIRNAIQKGKLSPEFDKPEFLALVRRDRLMRDTVTTRCQVEAESGVPPKDRKYYLNELEKDRKKKPSVTMSQHKLHENFGIPEDEKTKEAFRMALYRVCREEAKTRNAQDASPKAYIPGKSGDPNRYRLAYDPVADCVKYFINKYAPE